MTERRKYTRRKAQPTPEEPRVASDATPPAVKVEVSFSDQQMAKAEAARQERIALRKAAAEAEAREAAELAQRQAEEAKRQQEQQKRRAAEEAARAKAEAEAKEQARRAAAAAEEARKQAEMAAKAEEDRRRAEVAVRKAAAEKAKRQAEAVAKKREDDQRRKAEAEAAKLRAEEAATAAKRAKAEREALEAIIAQEAAALREEEAALAEAKAELEEIRASRADLEAEAEELLAQDAESHSLSAPAHSMAPEFDEDEEDWDVEDAWDMLQTFPVNEKLLEKKRIITAARREPAHATFDVLRTRILHAIAEHGWSRIAITSPTKDCGKSFVAANLAISMSRQDDCRTVLMDLDMRKPTVHSLFDVRDSGPIAQMLRGKVAPEDHLQCMGDNSFHEGRKLAFGFNNTVESYASEILAERSTGRCLDAIEAIFEPTVMLLDLPPALYFDDVLAMRPYFDAVLLVIGGGVTKPKEIKEVERRLGANTPLLGSVLNMAESTNVERYSY